MSLHFLNLPHPVFIILVRGSLWYQVLVCYSSHILCTQKDVSVNTRVYCVIYQFYTKVSLLYSLPQLAFPSHSVSQRLFQKIKMQIDIMLFNTSQSSHVLKFSYSFVMKSYFCYSSNNGILKIVVERRVTIAIYRGTALCKSLCITFFNPLGNCVGQDLLYFKDEEIEAQMD